MEWFTTKVTKYVELASVLNQLQTDGHTIVQLLTIDGAIVIISNKP